MKRLVIVIIVLVAVLLTGCFSLSKTTQSGQSTTTSEATTQTTTARVTNTETRPTKATTKTTTKATTTVAPTTTETYTRDELEEICENYKYKDIARMPDDYEGELIKFVGTVIQVMEYDEYTMLRVAENDDYDTVWIVFYTRPSGQPRVLDDDTVTVYGVCMGLYTYEATSGANISVPGALSEYVFIKP